MVDLPPAAYDAYSGGLVVIERPAPIVHQLCALMGALYRKDQRVLACSAKGFKACVIVVPHVDGSTSQKTHHAYPVDADRRKG